MRFNKTLLSMAVVSTMLVACSDGDDGQNGAPGADGQPGSNGLNSLIKQTRLSAGSDACFAGGLKVESGLDANSNNVLDADEVSETNTICNSAAIDNSRNFQRIATFPVCMQLEANCNIDTETAAEIVAASADGNTLIYSDSPNEALGFVNIANPESPYGLGTLALSGEPTSVGVKGDYAVVGVNTSADFVNVAGKLDVVNIATRTVVASLDLGGQPDSVAVSPDGNYIVIAIENERDEDLGDGAPPQMPAGAVVIVDSSAANPSAWTSSTVDVTGMTGALYESDPEPEFVDINADNKAVVTFQENNHIAIIDLASGTIDKHFTAGTVDLTLIDGTEGDPLMISQTESQSDVPREPDGVAWINTQYFATADEGDLNGGSRGFTVFDTDGNVAWTAGNTMDHLTAHIGHYPDKRSGNKGNEPENVEVGAFGSSRYLFVNSERSSVVAVYDVANPETPMFKQVLPAAAGPEGGLAIPSRNLLVVASEVDDRGDKLRSSLNIYRYVEGESKYPSIKSVDRADGSPIPWGALSGLAADASSPTTLYSIEDSFYGGNRIFTIDASRSPAYLTDETRIIDSNDVLLTKGTAMTSGAGPDNTAFDAADLAAMINDDKSVNIDPEGISQAADGGFWVVSEGAGTLSDAEKRPLESLNLLFKTNASGVIEDVISLPADVNAKQIRFGFEGVAEYNGSAYVAFQRAWEGEDHPRIGIYNVAAKTWRFVYYPLDARESQRGGWVGLSDITSVGDGTFLILERDNQGGPDAAIKRIYHVDLKGVADNAVVSKTLLRDLVTEGDLTAAGGLVAEKVEGLALTGSGDVYIANDNDGVDDNSGETQLINLGKLLP